MNAPDPPHWSQKVKFGCVSYFLGAIGTVSSPYETRFKTAELVRLMQKFVPRSRVGILATNASDPHHWTLNSCFGVFHRVWVHLAPFCHLTKLGSKWAELLKSMQKFVLRIRVGIFHNERTWSTTLDAKLLFGCIWEHFITLWNSIQNGPNWYNQCKSSCHEVFLQWMHPIHPIGP